MINLSNKSKRANKEKKLYDFLGYLFIFIVIVILVIFEREKENTILGYFIFSSFSVYFIWVLVRGLVYKGFGYGDGRVLRNEAPYKYYGCVASSILFASLSIWALVFWR